MAEYTYFGNRGRLYIGAEPIAVLKGVEVNVTMEHAELYSQSSILRADVAKHTAKVEVKFKAAKFDPTLAAGLAKIMGNTLKGATTGTATSLTDTNDVALFTVDLYVKGTGEVSTYLKISVANVYFEGLPFPAPENDFTVFDITGYGSTVTLTSGASLPA